MTTYYSMPGGGVAFVNGGASVVVDPSWISITETEYTSTLAALDASVAAAQAAERNAACLTRKANRDALIGLGLAPAVANSISGWNPGSC